MHIFEKAIDLAASVRTLASEQLRGQESLKIQLCNGTNVGIALEEKSGECAASFQKLLPGQCGTISFTGNGGFSSAVKVRIGPEELCLGAYTSKLKRDSRFGLQFTPGQPLARYLKGLPQTFMGAAKGGADRASGDAYVACCARGDSGAFAEAAGVAGAGEAMRSTGSVTQHPIMYILVAEAAELPARDDQPEQTALHPYMQFSSMDALQQTTFAEYLKGKWDFASLANAFFLSEYSAVLKSLRGASANRVREEAFALDLLIAAFPEGVLSDEKASNTFAYNDDEYRRARPAELTSSDGVIWEEYAEFPEERIVQLQAYVDAARALLFVTALQAARAIRPAVDECKSFGFTDRTAAEAEHSATAAAIRGALGSPAEPEVERESNCQILCQHLRKRSGSKELLMEGTRSSATEAGADYDLPQLLKTCIDTANTNAVRRLALVKWLRERSRDPRIQAALQHFEDWLPCTRREFSSPATDEVPSLTFRSFSNEVFNNLDGGKVASAKILLESLGQASSELKAMSTNSKSGEFFYFSGDRQFLLKTVSDNEGWILDDMLAAYQGHLRKRPQSFIVRFGGLFHVQMENGFSKFFTIMASVFDPTCKIEETYDVKGSLYNRKAKEGEGIKKDQDWYEAKKRLRLPEKLRRDLLEVHEADAAFLSSWGVMDYSLLIGVHHLKPNEQHDGSGWRKTGGLVSDPGPDGTREVYFVGLIDFLIFYHMKKEVEHIMRTAQGHGHDASCVKPEEYARRQVEFVRKAIFEDVKVDMGTLGILKVSGMSAKNLINTDLPLGKSDPYIVVQIGLQSARTRVIKNDLNPKWDDESDVLFLPLNKDHRTMPLILDIYDEDSVRAVQGSDDDLGILEIKMDTLLSGQQVQVVDQALQKVKHGVICATLIFERVPEDTFTVAFPSRR